MRKSILAPFFLKHCVYMYVIFNYIINVIHRYVRDIELDRL